MIIIGHFLTRVRRLFEDKFDKNKYLDVLQRFEYLLMIAIMTIKGTDMNVIGNWYVKNCYMSIDH